MYFCLSIRNIQKHWNFKDKSYICYGIGTVLVHVIYKMKRISVFVIDETIVRLETNNGYELPLN